MQDRFQRHINYLRISLTDRCNLRCAYCMPPEGIQWLPHNEILTIEEILAVVKAGVEVGIRKVRLTGGEPLVRRGIVDLIKRLNDIPEIDDIALTTNGMLLGAMASDLKSAGLKRVNVSLDTLNPIRFQRITRYGNLEIVMCSIDTALEYGLEPVKINTVAMRGFNDDELVDLARLTLEKPLHVRFIELMPIGTSDDWSHIRFISSQEIRELISKSLGNLEDVKKVTGSGPARYYRISGALGTIGFISAVSNHFCATCNRMRLTASGQLRPCLFSGREVDLKQVLRSGAGHDELVCIFKEAIMSKPNSHDLTASWEKDDRIMSQIGG
ncbi:Cyclic pyranopterin monophosphate synthase [Sporotomaculum syntrophicum]|uniref:GTP 3',8-cyclase n=1 Tax=Sporotomaculum syntrophicum TaxID=182264 RepID=A0A9D2WNQ6_9FIRM|nr:GTP 3',8-cyclase MoaA [Sporotomaculum syntrophicum]KAF1084106.1 Cyclic pyranopterin monophosphate synthase [Sporotomaculum syntrophicum]